MSERFDSQRLDDLLARLADETATPEDIAALEQILASDANARRRYVHYRDLHEEMRHRARVGQLETPSDRPVGGNSVRHAAEPARPASPTLGFRRHLLALSKLFKREMEYRESRDWRAVDGGHRHRGDASGSAPRVRGRNWHKESSHCNTLLQSLTWCPTWSA